MLEEVTLKGTQRERERERERWKGEDERSPGLSSFKDLHNISCLPFFLCTHSSHPLALSLSLKFSIFSLSSSLSLSSFFLLLRFFFSTRKVWRKNPKGMREKMFPSYYVNFSFFFLLSHPRCYDRSSYHHHEPLSPFSLSLPLSLSVLFLLFDTSTCLTAFITTFHARLV